MLNLHFRTEGGHGDLHEVLRVLFVDLELVGDLVQVLDGALGGQLETVGDPDGVDAFVDKRLCLLHERPTEHNDAGGAVANLIVLRIRIKDRKRVPERSLLNMKEFVRNLYKNP